MRSEPAIDGSRRKGCTIFTIFERILILIFSFYSQSGEFGDVHLYLIIHFLVSIPKDSHGIEPERDSMLPPSPPNSSQCHLLSASKDLMTFFSLIFFFSVLEEIRCWNLSYSLSYVDWRTTFDEQSFLRL